MPVRLQRVPFHLLMWASLLLTCVHGAQYFLMGTIFWQQLLPNNRTVQFELHTAWKYLSVIDGIRDCQCTGTTACGALTSPCRCACSGNLGLPIVGDNMKSTERFDFGDGTSTTVDFTVMALDPANDVLFARAVLTHLYSFNVSDAQTELIAGFYYQNRPSDIENNPSTELRILTNIKASSFHMSANLTDASPARLAQELTKRGNSPQLSSALPLAFDVPTGSSYRTFSFPAKVCTLHLPHTSCCCSSPPPPTQDVRILFKNWVWSFCSTHVSALFTDNTVPLDATIDASSGSVTIPPQPASRQSGKLHLCIAATNSFAFASMVLRSALLDWNISL